MIKGGNLAEIESPEENNYIMSLVKKLTRKFVFYYWEWYDIFFGVVLQTLSYEKSLTFNKTEK